VHWLKRPLHGLYRLLGPLYPRAILLAVLAMAHLVTLGGVALLLIYQDMSAADFWSIFAAAEALVLIETVLATHVAFRLVTPGVDWVRGARSPAQTVAAWQALTGLPRDFFAYRRRWALLLNLVPMSIFVVWLLELPWYSMFLLMAGSGVVVLYIVLLRFFGMEMTMRPVLADISRALPDGVDLGRPPVPLRLKLLAALPAINIITGVIVAGLSTTGQADLSDLGFDVLVAVVVAFTLSFELTVLLSRSVAEPVRALRTAVARVIEGDFSARVPVVANDETGALAVSFNRMVAGLQERERLREAFGSYVDPQLADRILAEGTMLEGEDVEVTVVFVDIRDFTAWAERTGARAVVSALNEFYDHIVPVLTRHGGHANKFIGDGLLGVFGAPDHLPDHADRGVAAALEIAALVRERYGERLRVGIGVNSGRVLAGTVGGGGRLDFTVIGDTVNTASRVEAATRETGDDVLVTDATCALVRSAPCTFTERDDVELRGKSRPVRLFACEPVEDPPAAEVAAGGLRRGAL
jgi:adenylate cyclase